jgi:hypothetical protein
VLRHLGYPREFSPDGREPLLYDYGVIDPAMDFKAMDGPHTRFGDVLELLLAEDDRYVIFGKGEEIAVRFPSAGPLASGLTRTFVLDTSGWCKDMDLHTAEPRSVLPLPYRAMPCYPYPADRGFPWSDLLRRDFESFHTRWLSGSR